MKIERPTLIIVAGGPGVGKSHLSYPLAREIENSVLICQDDISGAFLSRPDPNDKGIIACRLTGPSETTDSQFYKDNVGKQSYLALLQVARSNIAVGKTALIEGNYLNFIKFGYFQEVAIPYVAKIDPAPSLKLVLCHADKPTIAARIRARNAPRDAEKLASDEAMQKYIDSMPWIPAEIEKLDHLKVDGTLPREENLERILNYVRS